MSYWSVLRGRWGSGDGEIADIRIDSSFNAIATVPVQHKEIHDGSHYFVAGSADLAINDVLDFTWLMPAGPKEIHWTWKIDTAVEYLWQVYENAVATNPLANAITPYNNNRNSTNESATTMKFELQADLAAANTDTAVGGATLLESGTSGAGKQSGNIDRGSELVMMFSTLYCLRATANAAGHISFQMQWYEHTPKN